MLETSIRFQMQSVFYTFWLQGTAWYTKLKYGPMVEFGNLLNYTAMGVGNHDFDDSVDGFVPFAEQVEKIKQIYFDHNQKPSKM